MCSLYDVGEANVDDGANENGHARQIKDDDESI